MKPVLELRHVWKTYGTGDVKVEALRDINIKIEKGEYISIMGPSGSGKTTLMHMMGCLDKPTKGSVFIDGINTTKMDDKNLARIRGRKIGFVFQSYNLIPSLNALQNVEIPLIFQNLTKQEREKKREKAIELLTRLGLGKRLEHKPNQLSGGQQQRVAIVRALINDPSIILADEPTGNLDSKSGNEVLSIFKELNEEGKTVVVVTHEAYVAKRAERIIRIKDGRILNVR